MFCTTECWSCEDKSCEHYISKEKLYFENHQLKDRINKATEFIEEHELKYINNDDYDVCLFINEIENLLEILKGDSNE